MDEQHNNTRKEATCHEGCSESSLGPCVECGAQGHVGLITGEEEKGKRCLRCISGDPSAPIDEEWVAHMEECPNFQQDPDTERNRSRGATLRLEDGTEFELSNAQLGMLCAGIMLGVGSAHMEHPAKIDRGFRAANVMHERMGSEQCRDLIRKFKVVLDAAFPDIGDGIRQMEAQDLGRPPGSLLDLLKQALGPDIQVIGLGDTSPRKPFS